MHKCYLLKIYYRPSKNYPEYHTHEFLLTGTDESIDNIVHEEIKQFEKINSLPVEQMSIFEHLKSTNLKKGIIKNEF